MLYTDAKVAILAYSGIYAAGVFGWDLAELLLFALLLAPFSVSGGFIGGWLDNTLGSKRAIQISVGLTCLGMVGAVSTTPDQILFLFPYDATAAEPLWSFPYFQTLPEVIYLMMFMLLAITTSRSGALRANLLEFVGHRQRRRKTIDLQEALSRSVRRQAHLYAYAGTRPQGGWRASRSAVVRGAKARGATLAL